MFVHYEFNFPSLQRYALKNNFYSEYNCIFVQYIFLVYRKTLHIRWTQITGKIFFHNSTISRFIILLHNAEVNALTQLIFYDARPITFP